MIFNSYLCEGRERDGDPAQGGLLQPQVGRASGVGTHCTYRAQGYRGLAGGQVPGEHGGAGQREYPVHLVVLTGVSALLRDSAGVVYTSVAGVEWGGVLCTLQPGRGERLLAGRLHRASSLKVLSVSHRAHPASNGRPAP